MNRYVLTGVNLYGKGINCCRCGKPIKEVYSVYDNIENKEMLVGCTCIKEILKTNETISKSLEKELKKYAKLLKSYDENFDAEKEFDKIRKFVKEGKYKKSMRWDEELQIHRPPNLEELEKEHDTIIKCLINCNEYNKRDLKLQKEKLNKLVIKGILDIRLLEEA